MKSVLWGAVAVVAGALAVYALPAYAADSSKLLAQCNSNVENEELPPNVTVDQAKEFCTCLAEASDEQSVIDEMTELMSGSREERISRMQNGPAPSQGAQDAFGSCLPEGAGPPQQ